MSGGDLSAHLTELPGVLAVPSRMKELGLPRVPETVAADGLLQVSEWHNAACDLLWRSPPWLRTGCRPEPHRYLWQNPSSNSKRWCRAVTGPTWLPSSRARGAPLLRRRGRGEEGGITGGNHLGGASLEAGARSRCSEAKL